MEIDIHGRFFDREVYNDVVGRNGESLPHALITERKIMFRGDPVREIIKNTRVPNRKPGRPVYHSDYNTENPNTSPENVFSGRVPLKPRDRIRYVPLPSKSRRDVDYVTSSGGRLIPLTRIAETESSQPLNLELQIILSSRRRPGLLELLAAGGIEVVRAVRFGLRRLSKGKA